MLNIPLAISAQQINYNIPGLNNVHLNLSGPVLAAIYSGQIQYWDDAKIKEANKSAEASAHSRSCRSTALTARATRSSSRNI